MTENFSKEIKAEQGKVHTLEKDIHAKEKDVPKTKEVFAKNQEIFADELDETRKYLARAEKDIKNPKYLFEVETDKNQLKTYLQSVAEKGREAFIQEGKGENPDEAKLQTVEKSAKATQEKGNQLKNAIPYFIQLDQAQEAYKEINLGVVEEIKNDKDIEPGKKRSMILKLVEKNIKDLSEIKKGVLSNYAPPEFQELTNEILEPINDDLEAMSKYQMYYEFHDFCLDPKYKKYVNFDEENGTVNFNEEFKKLPAEEQQKIIAELYALKLTIQSNIELQSCTEKHEESFYTGRKALLNGNYLEAKTAFLDFYNAENRMTHHTPENEQRLSETKESLKQIMLMQLAKSENQLHLIEESFAGQEVELSTGKLPIGESPLSAQSNLQAMKEVFAKAKELADGGTFLTIEDLYTHLRTPPLDPILAAQQGEGAMARFRNGFMDENGKSFGMYDVLGIQTAIDNPNLKPEARKELILYYAKISRELGLPELSKHYYDQYFKPQLDHAKQSIPHGEFVQKMRDDKNFNAQIKEKTEQWMQEGIDQYLKEFKDGHNNSSPNLNAVEQVRKKIEAGKGEQQEKLFSNMSEEAYNKAIHRFTHQKFKSDKPSINGSKPEEKVNWDQAFGTPIVNLENYDTNWYEFWKFSDAEWNKQKINFTLEITMLMASGFAGGLIGEAVAAGTLWEDLAARGLTQAGREALQKGSGQFALFVTRELGTKRALQLGIKITAADTGAMTAIDGALKSVWLGDTSTYDSPESFMKAWGKNVAIVAGAKAGSLGYSFVPKPRILPPEVAAHMGAGIKTLYNMEMKGLHGAGGLAVELTSVTATTVGLAIASNPNITQEEIAKIIQSNTLITLGMKGGHLLAGHKTSSEKPDEPAKTPYEEITIRKTKEAEQAKAEAEVAVARAREAKAKGAKNAPQLEQQAKEALQEARVKTSEVRRKEDFALKVKTAHEAAKTYTLDQYDPLTDPEYLSLKGNEDEHLDFIARKVKRAVQKKVMDEASPELHEQIMALASKLEPGTNTGPWLLIRSHTSEETLPPGWQKSDNTDLYIPGKSLVLEYEAASKTAPGKKQKFYKILNVATIDTIPSLGMNMDTVEGTKEYFDLKQRATNEKGNILDAGYKERQKKLDEVGTANFKLADQLEGATAESQKTILNVLSRLAELTGEENPLQTVIDPNTDKPFINSYELELYLFEKLSNAAKEQKKMEETKDPSEDQSSETNYSVKLRKAIREINERTDLKPEEKVALIRQKTGELRKEIAERTGIIGKFIEEYLVKIQNYLETDPNYPREKFIAEIDQNPNLSDLFTPEEINKIRSKTLEAFTKAKNVQTYYEIYKPNPKILFEMQFGFKPKGEITLMKRTFALIFQIHNIEDYKQVSGEKDSNSALSSGFSTSYSPLNDLKGMITTLNGEQSPEQIEEVNIHEERHNENRIIFSEERKTKALDPPPYSPENPAENEKNYEMYIQKLFTNSLEKSTTRGKDEILAYMRDGSSAERITQTLTQSSLYDYWQQSYTAELSLQIQMYGHLLSPKALARFTENLKSYPKKHNQIITAAVQQAFKIGITRIDELAVTPITSWGKMEEIANPNLKTIDDLKKYTEQEGGIVLYHGGLPDNTDMSKIDLNKPGSQQNKKGKSYGGFYLSDESSKDWAIDYAKKRNGNLHAFRIDKAARILDMSDTVIDRLSQKERDEFAKEYDVVKGKDVLGRVQFVVLNKAVVKEIVMDKIPTEKPNP